MSKKFDFKLRFSSITSIYSTLYFSNQTYDIYEMKTNLYFESRKVNRKMQVYESSRNYCPKVSFEFKESLEKICRTLKKFKSKQILNQVCESRRDPMAIDVSKDDLDECRVSDRIAMYGF